jgi:hypothetical protein
MGVPFVELMTALGYDMAKVTAWDDERKAEKAQELAQAKAQQTAVVATNGRFGN